MLDLVQCDVCKAVNAVPHQDHRWYSYCQTCGTTRSGDIRKICEVPDGQSDQSTAQ